MKNLTAAIAASLFAVSANASDIYWGLEQGNQDLSTPRLSSEDFAGVQPSVGDSVDRYHGWADGNPDLFKPEGRGPTDSGNDPNIYTSFSGNPDLSF